MVIDRRLALVGAAALAVAVIAVPVLGADPTPAPSDTPGQGQGRGQTGERPDKGPEVAVELRGTVVAGTDDKGRPTYTMTVSGTTWELSAGPAWYWGDGGPLKALAGRTVTVAGTHREGRFDVDVETVDGRPIRAEGMPPWAGGPKAQGERHPGWKPWKDGDGWKAWKDGDKPGNGPKDDAPGASDDPG
ncbi:MAG: hypothetical protein ACLGIJ_11850 [Candidatus Limnocylindria bacterium]